MNGDLRLFNKVLKSWALLLAFGSFLTALSPVFAKPPVDLRCASEQLQLVGGLAPSSYARVLSITDFKNRYLYHFKEEFTHQDNLSYYFVFRKEMDRTEKLQKGPLGMKLPPNPGEPVLHFEMENPILKEMNDRIFKDQDMATAVNNLYREHFFKVLNDPTRKESVFLKSKIVNKYSDYKTIRLGLVEDSPEIRRMLASLYQEAAGEFRKAAFGLGFQDAAGQAIVPFTSFLENQRGIALDPAAYNLAGIGRTIPEASVSARMARSFFPAFESGRPVAMEFERVAGKLDERLKDIELRRARIENLFRSSPGASPSALVQVPGTKPPKYVISEKAVAFFRRERSSEPIAGGVGGESYKSDISGKFKAVFAIDLKDEDVSLIREYFNLTDTFSPGLFHFTPKPEPYEAAGGGFFVDHVGLGARNAQSTMEALALKLNSGPYNPRGLVREALQNSWSKLEEVTFAFENRSIQLNQALKATETSGTKGVLVNSGDELEYYGKLDREKRKQVLREVTHHVKSSDIRTAYLPDRYVDGSLIQAVDRHALKEKALSFEKTLRDVLESAGNKKVIRNAKTKDVFGGDPLFLDLLNKVQIHIEYAPATRKAGGIVDLILTGPGAEEPEVVSMIEMGFKEAIKTKLPGMRAGKVELNLPRVGAPRSFNMRHNFSLSPLSLAA